MSDVVFVGQNALDVVLVVAPEVSLQEIVPDLSAIAKINTRGVIVTGTAGAVAAKADFVSRFLAPRVGVPEDPVTGSAHCCLAPYWVAELGRNPLHGYQASQRPGYVEVEVTGDCVKLRGSAVTVMRGELTV